MLGRHLGRALTEQQRGRWVRLMGEAAYEAGLPADPEFRSAFVFYLEWGSRPALANSQPGAQPRCACRFLAGNGHGRPAERQSWRGPTAGRPC